MSSTDPVDQVSADAVTIRIGNRISSDNGVLATEGNSSDDRMPSEETSLLLGLRVPSPDSPLAPNHARTASDSTNATASTYGFLTDSVNSAWREETEEEEECGDDNDNATNQEPERSRPDQERQESFADAFQRTVSLLASPLASESDVERMIRSPLLPPLSSPGAVAKMTKSAPAPRLVRPAKREVRFHPSTSFSDSERNDGFRQPTLARAQTMDSNYFVGRSEGSPPGSVHIPTPEWAEMAEQISVIEIMKTEKECKRQEAEFKRQEEEESREGKATFGQCLFNMANILLGVGILGLPFGFMSAGWIGGLAVMAAFAAITCRTAILIGRSLNGDARPSIEFARQDKKSLLPERRPKKMMRVGRRLKTFPDIAHEAFGDVGMFLLSIVFYFELFSCLAIFLVALGDHMNVLLPALTVTQHEILMAALLAVVTVVLATPKLISYLSAVGIYASIVVVASVLGAALLMGDVSDRMVGENGLYNGPPYHIWWNGPGLPMALGLAAYCFSGHATVPSIYSSMARPEYFERMICCSFLLVLACTSAVAISGYYAFGCNVQDQVTLSIADLPGIDKGSYVALLTTLIVVNSVATFTLTMCPLAVGCEEAVLPIFEDAPERVKKMASAAIRVGLIILALLVAIFVPSFSFLCSLVGLISTMTVSVVFPPAAYIFLFRSQIPLSEKVVGFTISTVGAISAVAGTYATISHHLQNG